MNSSIPQRLFCQNRQKLVSRLRRNSFAVFHSNDEMPRTGDQFFPFRQNSDLFYLTGINQVKSILVICPEHPIQKNREILFISKPDPHFETWFGKQLTRSEACEISGIQTILWLEEYESVIRDCTYHFNTIYINQYESTKFITDVESRDLRSANKLKKIFPGHQFERLSPIMRELRLIKEPEEVNVIQYASSITEKGFRRVLNTLRPGMLEFEIEAELTYEFIKNGAQGHAFYPIVASGENACILHYVTNRNVCKDGDLLLLDFGAEYSNYAADCSRTIPVNGRFTKRQKELYNAVLNVFNKAKSLMVKGTSIALIGKQVNKLMEEEHLRLGLYTEDDLKQQDPDQPLYTRYFMHGISHFMGLDVHDYGSRFQTLEPGMILTCEPGIYVREEGIGIRIENDILVTEDEPIDLMQNIPVEAEEIEELMSKK